MYADINKNKFKTFVVIFGFVATIVLIVYALYYTFDFSWYFIVMAFVFAIISAVLSYYNCDKIVLKIANARPATHEEDLHLTNILDALMLATRLPKKPRLYVIDSLQPNAFATGRNPEHAVICVTTGLLNKLDYYELEGVIAHELSHVKNYDILLSGMISILVGFVLILSNLFLRYGFFFGGGNRRKDSRSSSNSSDAGNIIQLVLLFIGIILLIFSPIISEIIQLMVSRRREYLADATAVQITRNPQGLISALRKLEEDSSKPVSTSKEFGHMYIINPLKNKRKSKDNLFSTHPSTENRIKAILKLK